MTDNTTTNHLNANKPDDRSDNAKRIQRNISCTLQNVELGNEMIAETSDPKLLKQLHDKNKRRQEAIKDMKEEMAEEMPYSHQKTK